MCGGPALRDRPEVEGDGLPGGQGGLVGGGGVPEAEENPLGEE